MPSARWFATVQTRRYVPGFSRIVRSTIAPGCATGQRTSTRVPSARRSTRSCASWPHVAELEHREPGLDRAAREREAELLRDDLDARGRGRGARSPDERRPRERGRVRDHRRRVDAEPLLEERRVDAAEVRRSRLRLPSSSRPVFRPGNSPTIVPFDARADEEADAGRAVVGAARCRSPRRGGRTPTRRARARGRRGRAPRGRAGTRAASRTSVCSPCASAPAWSACVS